MCGEGVGPVALAGDGDGAGGLVDVGAANLGDLVDAQAGVGGQEDLDRKSVV